MGLGGVVRELNSAVVGVCVQLVGIWIGRGVGGGGGDSAKILQNFLKRHFSKNFFPFSPL